MQATGGELLAAALVSENVDSIFGLPGIQLYPAMDALYHRREEISFVSVRHEQSATYMADGYARVSGNPGVAMVVPGPGVLNAGAGLATAYACSSPVLLISGQIDSNLIGRGLGALHELPDQSAVLRSLTKWSGIARHPGQIPELVHEAFFHLRSGRPQPVALEIPPDVLSAVDDAPVGTSWLPAVPEASAEVIREVAELVSHSERPMIYLGGGAIASDAGSVVIELAETLGIPVVLSRNGRGSVDSRHPLVFDPLALRELSGEADLVLAIGSRMGSGAGGNIDVGSGKLVIVNADERDFDPPRPPHIRVHSDAAIAVRKLLDAVRGHGTPPFTWGATLSRTREWVAEQFDLVAPQLAYLEAIRSAMPDDGVFVSEYTQVGYVASVAFPNHRARGFISPGYQGTLGYGYATALGAAVAAAPAPVVSITGDGGFSWTMSELSTAKKYGIPATVVLFNDGYYGNVRRGQRDRYGGRYIASELCNPDYVALAGAFDIAANRVSEPDELADQLARSITSGKPSLIEVSVGEFPSGWPLIDEPGN